MPMIKAVLALAAMFVLPSQAIDQSGSACPIATGADAGRTWKIFSDKGADEWMASRSGPLAVLTKRRGRGPLEAAVKRGNAAAAVGASVVGAPWGIVPLKTCYGNPGGADATADAVLEASAATETLCPTAQSATSR
jgi:hypothetical protein